MLSARVERGVRERFGEVGLEWRSDHGLGLIGALGQSLEVLNPVGRGGAGGAGQEKGRRSSHRFWLVGAALRRVKKRRRARVRVMSWSMSARNLQTKFGQQMAGRCQKYSERFLPGLK